MEARTVKSVLDSYWDGVLPVNPDVIAQQLGINVLPLNSERNPNVSGMAEILSDGRKMIGYNKFDSHSRIRFTVAHELAHHVLGHTARYSRCLRDYSTNSNPENPWVETEANRFAAELLMPGDAVNMLVKREGVTDINKLAYYFDVSEKAMYWRLKNLGYPI
jgi:Zn-dependent peptidase ImmA (M78 family)